MTRLIDADKLHDLFDKNCVGDCNVCNFYTSVHYVIHNKDCKGHSYCGLIDNEPTVDTDLSKYSDKLWKEAYERGKNERPQGEWIKESKLWGGFGDSVLVNTCSECGESFIYHGNNPKFCPECGADMREVEQ